MRPEAVLQNLFAGLGLSLWAVGLLALATLAASFRLCLGLIGTVQPIQLYDGQRHAGVVSRTWNRHVEGGGAR